MNGLTWKKEQCSAQNIKILNVQKHLNVRAMWRSQAVGEFFTVAAGHHHPLEQSERIRQIANFQCKGDIESIDRTHPPTNDASCEEFYRDDSLLERQKFPLKAISAFYSHQVGLDVPKGHPDRHCLFKRVPRPSTAFLGVFHGLLCRL